MAEGRRDGFVPRVLTYHASRDLVPLYSVYALLFADHGVEQRADLPALHHLVADVVRLRGAVGRLGGHLRPTATARPLGRDLRRRASRRWMVWQTFAGFAVGFVCWGLSSALMSGTFESMVYDELVERGARGARTPRLIGWAHSTAMVANLVATAAAAPLFDVGGYALVGWTSRRDRRRPGRPRRDAAGLGTGPAAPARRGLAARRHRARGVAYVAMLRAGLAESRHHPDVRRVLLLAAAMVGLTAYDEYFPLVARDHGVATSTVPLLIAVTVLGQVVGTALVGRTARFGGPVRRAACSRPGAVLVSIGALATPYPGFVAIARRLRPAQQRDARRRDPAPGHHHRSGPGHGHQRARAARGGRRARRVRRVRARSHVLGFPTLVALLGVPGRARRRCAVAPPARPTGRAGVRRGFFGRRTRVLTSSERGRRPAAGRAGGSSRWTSRSPTWAWPTSAGPRSPSPSTRCPA